MSREHAYREELLHWLWETSRIQLNRLETTEGKPITVFHPGTLNKADGPDFLNAHIQIGKLQWFGDVEIHWQSDHWVHHGHQSDPNYNRVILHVVWTCKAGSETLRNDGSTIPTLVLESRLSKPLQSFFNQYTRAEVLPCSGSLSFISRKAFEQQLRKAEKEYFEQKVDDLLSYWDASLSPSRAWCHMLATGLFDGLGIAQNREGMRNLFNEIYPALGNVGSKSELISLAVSEAAAGTTQGSIKYGWVHKGSRPANHPRVRIKQAACCMWYIYQLPFKKWLNTEPIKRWEELNAQITTCPGLGRQRKDILFGTVWLPSLFILGKIFASPSLQNKALKLWQNHRTDIPGTLLRPFQSLDIPETTYRHSLGAVYQLRSYCRPRHCEACKVFKSVISS